MSSQQLGSLGTAAVAQPLSFNFLLSKSIKEASHIAQYKGYTIRIIQINGVDMIRTLDHVSNRINVAVKLHDCYETIDNRNWEVLDRYESEIWHVYGVG